MGSPLPFISYVLLFWGGAHWILGSLAQAETTHRSISAFNPGTVRLGVETQSFLSRANIEANGESKGLHFGHRFLTYDVALSGAYDFNDRWSLSNDLILGYAESFNGRDLRNARKFKGFKLGVQRVFSLKMLEFVILDGLYYQNFTTNNSTQDQVSMDDGVSWFQGGVWWDFFRRHEVFNLKTYAGLRFVPRIFRTYL